LFSFQKTELDGNRREPEAVDEAVELLSHPQLAQPHLVSGAATRHEAHVPQPGGRGGSPPGHRRRQVQRQRQRRGRLMERRNKNVAVLD
jgi:hypothetical protein